jgi:hypothetical protein
MRIMTLKCSGKNVTLLDAICEITVVWDDMNKLITIIWRKIFPNK